MASSHIVYFDQMFNSKRAYPRFFAREGVNALDIEFGKYIERTEENAVFHGLIERKVHVVEGMPASGKSSILSKIGHRLTKTKGSKYHVACIDGGQINVSNIAEVKQEIESLYDAHGSNLFFFIDDMHKSFEPSNEVAHFLISTGIPMLIGTRPSYKLYTDVKIGNLLLELQATDERYFTHLSSESVADKIVDNALSSFGANMTEGEKSQILKDSKNNLWILSFLLEGFDKTGSASYESISTIISKQLSEFDYHDAGEIIAAIKLLSLAGEYEISIERDILEKIFSKECIACLSDSDLLKKSGKGLVFYHASVASIYADYFFFIDSEIDSKGDELTEFLAHYISLKPETISKCIKALSLSPSSIESLLSVDSAFSALSELINDDTTDLSSIAEIITDACRQGSNKIAEIIEAALSDNETALINKINKEKSISEINFLIGSIPWHVMPEYLAPTISLNSLANKRLKSGELDRNQCLYHLKVESEKTDWLLAEEITSGGICEKNVYDISAPCTRFKNLETPYLCLKSSMCTPSPVAAKIILNIDYEELIVKFNNCSKPLDILRFIHSLYWVLSNTVVNASVDTRLINFLKDIEARSDPEFDNYLVELQSMFGIRNDERIICKC